MTATEIITLSAAILTCILILLSFYFFSKKLDLLIKKTVQGKQTGNNHQLFTFKIQAYERILLYIERIELESLVMRVFLPEMTVQQLQAALLRAIREEFEHNTTQQLYVTERAWECVKAARAFVLAIVTQACKELSPSDSGMQFAQMLFAYGQDKETYTFNKFPLTIKREMEQDLSS
jgi:hypothetical protein